MALKQCPECKKEISDEANTCPHCGKDFVYTGENFLGCLGCFGIIIIIAVILEMLRMLFM